MDQTANAESNEAQNGNTNKPRGEASLRTISEGGATSHSLKFRLLSCIYLFRKLLAILAMTTCVIAVTKTVLPLSPHHQRRM